MEDSVSVIIPTYNRAGMVPRAVESALAAITAGDEIIVVDDGSTDNTAEVLRPLYDKIRYVRTENSGAGAARNVGIELSTCPFVAFLDSDDEWLPDKLYVQRAVMGAYPDVIFCFSDLLSRHGGGKIFHNVLSIWKNDVSVGHRKAKETLYDIFGPGVPFSKIAKLPEGRTDFTVHTGDIYAALMEVYYVWTCSIMVRKELAGALFRFPEDMNIFEEWQCFAQLATAGKAAFLSCELAVQNVHTDTRLTDVEGLHQATMRIKLLNRVWGVDEPFLKKYSLRFRSVLAAQYLRRAKYLIRTGRIQEAKKDLDVLGGGPLAYRLLVSLPTSVVTNMLSIRRRLKES